MKFYNTLTRQKEEFKPLRYPEVKMYQCGPTVYNYAHIGNLKTSVVEDMVARVLRYLGYQVTVTMNITDIDDKTIRDSQKAGKKLGDFTQYYTEKFVDDLELLCVEMPDVIEPISQIIPEMVRMIQTLLNKGIAYHADDGSIYYNIAKFKKYGKLGNLDIKGMKSSVRIDNDEYEKESVADFVLWKAHKDEDGENYWDEEFTIDGDKKIVRGRPGWHIECSACAMKNFGKQIDIHMGGEDLVFPHHENEIAQTEACTGKQFSKYWLHSGHMLVGGKKMSKSLGNFYTLRHIEEKYPDEKKLYRALRYIFLNGKYRDQVDFSFEKLESTFNTLENIDKGLKRLSLYTSDIEATRKEFSQYLQDVKACSIDALEDDCNIPEFLAVFFEFQKYSSSQIEAKELSEGEKYSLISMYEDFDAVLGIFDLSVLDQEQVEIPQDIIDLAKKRDQAKTNKDFELADKIRDDIQSAGYSMRDTKEGGVVEAL